MPLDGKCVGMDTPYKLLSNGNCGGKIHWFGCDSAKVGAHGCFNAVMAEPKCVKDYFTYNERGDQNCGCKVSSETELIIHEYDFADCYEISKSDTVTNTATLEDTTTTTTPCESTAANLVQNEVEAASGQHNPKEFLWTAAGVDAAHASNEFEVFDSPVVG